MRVDLEEKEFAQYLLNVGNGDLATTQAARLAGK